MAALKHFYRDLGAQVWSIYGFRDAFNLQQNWYSGITMGLNQAPMVVMIENYRSGLVWKNFMANPEVRPALERIGFRADTPGTANALAETVWHTSWLRKARISFQAELIAWAKWPSRGLPSTHLDLILLPSFRLRRLPSEHIASDRSRAPGVKALQLMIGVRERDCLQARKLR